MSRSVSFFFSSRGRHTRWTGDWSSDVCSSDLEFAIGAPAASVHAREVFGPVASLLPYSGKGEDAAAIVARGNGGLVSSVYSEDARSEERRVGKECRFWESSQL